HRGRESIAGMWRMWRDMFEDFRAEAEEYIGVGDSVIAPGWLGGRGRHSGVDVREPYTWVMGGAKARSWKCASTTPRPKPSKPWGWPSRRHRLRRSAL